MGFRGIGGGFGAAGFGSGTGVGGAPMGAADIGFPIRVLRGGTHAGGDVCAVRAPTAGGASRVGLRRRPDGRAACGGGGGGRGSGRNPRAETMAGGRFAAADPLAGELAVAGARRGHGGAGNRPAGIPANALRGGISFVRDGRRLDPAGPLREGAFAGGRDAAAPSVTGHGRTVDRGFQRLEAPASRDPRADCGLPHEHGEGDAGRGHGNP